MIQSINRTEESAEIPIKNEEKTEIQVGTEQTVKSITKVKITQK